MDTRDYVAMNASVRPEHYDTPIAPIDYILANEMDFCTGNIIKYASRAGKKVYDGKNAAESAITDLMKVQEYASFKIFELREMLALEALDRQS